MIRPSLPAGTSVPSSSASNIVFIDRAVADHAALAAALAPGYEAIFIDSDRDGLDQVAAALEGRTGIASVSIVSHGAVGVLSLGSSQVSIDNIADFAPELAALRAALAPGADLLLYGCDIAASDDGRAMADVLAAATGADVGASTDRSANAALDGDWTLEYQTGTIAAASLLPETALATVNTALATKSYVQIQPSPVPEFTTGNFAFLTGDFNGDGAQDMLRAAQAAGVGYTLTLYINQGAGLSTSSAIPHPPFSNVLLAYAQARDFDGDGDLDVYIPMSGATTDIYLLNDGTGHFTQAPAPIPEISTANNERYYITGDFDGDGDVDFLRQENGVGSAAVFYENTGGTFVVSQKASLPAVPNLDLSLARTVDFDGDGDLDLYLPLVNASNETAINNDIYLRNDGGQFSVAANPVAEFKSTNPSLFIAADFDGDGDQDLIRQAGRHVRRLPEEYQRRADAVVRPGTDLADECDLELRARRRLRQ